MRRPKLLLVLLFLLSCFSYTAASIAQTEPVSLQLGQSVERTIKRGDSHSFNLNLKVDQFLQLVVDQRGIDVVVRAFSPDGKSLGEFDSPNGVNGPENVSIITKVNGLYRIEVSPLGQEGNQDSGRYEIKILDLRAATNEELEVANNRETARRKGLALLIEVANSLQQIRLPETRVRLQLQTAQLIWASDEKRARKLVDEAIEGINQYMAGVDPDDQNYYQGYQTALQLRNDLLAALTPSDPELALSILRSTRVLVDPNAGQYADQYNQESQLELSVASQIAAKNPKRALQIAQENLKKGYSYNLLDTVNQLIAPDRDSAARLAGEIAAKLQSENLLKNQTAGNLVINLLQTANYANNSAAGADTAKTPLLTEKQYRDLFSQALSAALAYSPSSSGVYSPERSSAQSILTSLKSMTSEMEKYAPGKAAAVEKSLTELNASPDLQSRLLLQYQGVINNGSITEALEAAAKAPQEISDQTYQQVAMKAASGGDLALAKQILTEHIPNPIQRQQLMRSIDQQAVYGALNNGKFEQALRNVNTIRPPNDRAMMIIQIVNQFGGNQKKATLLELLEQARGLTVSSGRAEDQDQMNALFEIAGAYFRLDPKRGFEVLEPLVDQFNEMCAAAVVMNGFGQQYFLNGELLLHNGNSMATFANQLMNTLGISAISDFDRAKAAADKMQRAEARLATYLSIAQQTINEETSEGRRILTYRHP